MMKKSDCLRWAEALWEGKYKKFTGRMSNAKPVNKPTACCCLGVANETFKVVDYEVDRYDGVAYRLCAAGVFKQVNPRVFGVLASNINDGKSYLSALGIPADGLTHKEISWLLLLAIETGEYKNI